MQADLFGTKKNRPDIKSGELPIPTFTYHLRGCVKSKHQVFFDILYKKGNALYLFILVFLLLSFGK